MLRFFLILLLLFLSDRRALALLLKHCLLEFFFSTVASRVSSQNCTTVSTLTYDIAALPLIELALLYFAFLQSLLLPDLQLALIILLEFVLGRLLVFS